jgi:hypothetical protein
MDSNKRRSQTKKQSVQEVPDDGRAKARVQTMGTRVNHREFLREDIIEEPAL